VQDAAGNVNFTSAYDVLVAGNAFDFSVNVSDLSYVPVSAGEFDNVSFNLTVHNNDVVNVSGLNVSFYVDSVLNSSVVVDIARNASHVIVFNWTASGGSHSLLWAVDSNGSFAESSESNNNLSLSLNVSWYACAELISPANGSSVFRGNYTSSLPHEDVLGIVSDYLTVRGRVYRFYNSSEGVSANCSFYLNGSYLGMNATNSSGHCGLSFDKTVYAPGYYNLSVNYSDAGVNYSAAQGNSSIIFRLVRVRTDLDAINLRGNSRYMAGDAAVLNISVEDDFGWVDAANLTVKVKNTGMSCSVDGGEISVHTYPGDIERRGIGSYLSRTVLSSESDIHWCVYVSNYSENMSSSTHADLFVDPSTAFLNVTAYNSSLGVLDSSADVFDRNGYLLESKNFSLADSRISRYAALYDLYDINISSGIGSMVLRGVNLTLGNVSVGPQFASLEGGLPSDARNISTIVALDTTQFSMQNALITLPKSFRIDYIYHCTDWNYSSGVCGSWEKNSTGDYSYGENGTHFWFTVASFTAYAGGMGYNSNLTIWDDTDLESKYAGEQVLFYANYTNGTSGDPVNGTGIYCEYSENSSGSWSEAVNMSYNASSGVYEYNRSFASGGTYYYNISCVDHNTGYDNLSAADGFTIEADSTAPVLSFEDPTAGNGSTISVNWTRVNISIDEPNLDSFMFDWNGSNYSLYDDSLVLALNFNNNSAIGENSTLVLDVSGNGFVCDVSGGAVWNSSGRFGGAYQFLDSDDGVSCVVGINTSSSTFEFWLRDDGSSVDWGDYLNFDMDGSSRITFEYYNDSGVSMVMPVARVEEAYFDAPSIVLEEGFHHYAVVFSNVSGSRVSYRDGVLVGSYVDGWPGFMSAYVHIAQSDTKSMIDEVRVYDRALSAQEVWMHYQAEFAKYNSTTYRFYANLSNLSSGSYSYYGWANDSAGNSNYTNGYNASSPRYLTISLIEPDTMAPALNFSSPTAGNGSTITVNWTQVNISIEEQNLDSFKFNWNGTNYTFYDDSLVLALNFNNNSVLGDNSSYVVDSSRYGNNASCFLSSCPVWNASGQFGGAFKYNRSAVYFNVSHNPSVNFSNATAFTVEAWVYLVDVSGSAHLGIVSKGVSTGYFSLYYKRDSLQWRFLTYHGGVYLYAEKLDSSATNRWVHLTGVYNGSNTIRLYINGVLANSASGSIGDFSSAAPLEIGTNKWTNWYWNGSIDEVRVYNRSLSAQEVWMHYQSEFMKYNSTQYRFYANLTNLSSGTYTYYGWANDSAGNSNYTDSSNSRYLTIARSPPYVSLIAPANNSEWTESRTVNFTYNVSGGYDIVFCDLLLNDVVGQTNTLVTKNTDQYFNLFLPDGIYNWSVNCSDSEGHSGRSDDYNLSVSSDWLNPNITDVVDGPDPLGYGYNVSINASASSSFGISTVWIGITPPGGLETNYSMTNVSDLWQYNYTGTWKWGAYNYTIYVNDSANNINWTNGSFSVKANVSLTVATKKDSYGPNEIVNLTDPPAGV
jgi:hypothetical protein